MRTKSYGHCLAPVLFALANVSAVQSVAAQTPENRPATYAFNLPAQSLADSLVAITELTGLQLIASSDLTRGRNGGEIKGTLSLEQALSRLLAGSGLTFRFVDARTISIEAARAGQRVLGPVRVEGADGNDRRLSGNNGSRDRTATEGSGSYTSDALTLASKLPQAMQETPFSVSVVTAQLIEDRDIDSFEEALGSATGINFLRTDVNGSPRFYSRGFQLNTIQIDGGAPLTTRLGTSDSSSGYYPFIDLAQYDHVEILRGAAGLFNGYGDPSGTINLVRKRPLDKKQVVADVEVGSWESYRAVFDATAPIGFDGRLRGRAVISYQDNEFFYKVANNNQTMAYGVLEYDVMPSTVASVGLSSTRRDTVPASAGLPRYQNGDDLRLPRDTALGFPWNRFDTDTQEIFASLDHRFGAGWQLKVTATDSDQHSFSKVGTVSGAVNPITYLGPRAGAGMSEFGADQRSIDGFVSGSFTMLGQTQKIVLGGSYLDVQQGGTYLYRNIVLPSYPANIDIFTFDPFSSLYTEPGSAERESYRKSGQTQLGAYLNLDLTAFERFHLATGFRWSRWSYKSAGEGFCPSSQPPAACRDLAVGAVYSRSKTTYEGDNFTWPPHVALRYDIGDAWGVYVGYSDVYQSQADLLDRDLNPLDPITGSNVELGVKYAALDGSLTASVAAFRIEQKNWSIRDASAFIVVRDPVTGRNQEYAVANDGTRFLGGDVVGSGTERTACCYITDPNRSLLSEGADLELTGAISSTWQSSVGYTWNRTERDGSYFGTNPRFGEGTPSESRLPEHTLKIWTNYDFQGDSGLGRLSVSGGLRYKSRSYFNGSACIRFVENAQGQVVCDSANGGNVPYAFEVPSHAVWSARLGYDLSDEWSLSLNVENATDETYYENPGSSTGGNQYGEPRRYALSLRGRW